MNNFSRLLEKKAKPVKLGTVFETQVTFKIIDDTQSPPKWKTIAKLETAVVRDDDVFKKLKSLNKKYDARKNIWLFWAFGQKEMASEWLNSVRRKL